MTESKELGKAGLRAHLDQKLPLVLTVEELVYVEVALRHYYDAQERRGQVVDRLARSTWAATEQALYGRKYSDLPARHGVGSNATEREE